MSDIELLYETPETGQLGIDELGKAKRTKAEDEYTGPSLSGPIPRYGHQGSTGMGGSLVDPEAGQASPVEASKRPQDIVPRQLSPEELLAWADRQNADMAQQHAARMAEGPAVHPSLDSRSPPDWLKDYMDTQGPTSPYYEPPQTGVDIVNGNKYLTEQEKLKFLRFMQKGH